MNAESSRSHLICSLVVKLANRRTGTEVIGKLTLVDLAGSEVNDNNLIIFTLKAFIILFIRSIIISYCQFDLHHHIHFSGI